MKFIKFVIALLLLFILHCNTARSNSISGAKQLNTAYFPVCNNIDKSTNDTIIDNINNGKFSYYYSINKCHPIFIGSRYYIFLSDSIDTRFDLWFVYFDYFDDKNINSVYIGKSLLELFGLLNNPINAEFNYSNLLDGYLSINSIHAIELDNNNLSIYFEVKFDNSNNLLKSDYEFDLYNLSIDLSELFSDADNDGLTDILEIKIGTSKFNADSDKDGIDDIIDTNPLSPANHKSIQCDLINAILTADLFNIQNGYGAVSDIFLINYPGSINCSIDITEKVIVNRKRQNDETIPTISIKSIEYDSNGSQAIINIAYYFGILSSYQKEYILVKVNDEWIIKNTVVKWRS